MKTLTDYIDTPSVRIFQAFAGDTLDKLDRCEVADVITVLVQAHSDAETQDFSKISTSGLAGFLGLEISELTGELLKALEGFPTDKTYQLVLALIMVGLEESLQ